MNKCVKNIYIDNVLFSTDALYKRLSFFFEPSKVIGLSKSMQIMCEHKVNTDLTILINYCKTINYY